MEKRLMAQGFSLVELMVVVAIMGILAAVAVPAYINHINRTKQANALETLFEVRMAQEQFYALKDRYARTIGSLEGFSNVVGTTWYDNTTTKGYRFRIIGTTASATYFNATAEGELGGSSSSDWSDKWRISSSIPGNAPVQTSTNNEGFKFSIVKFN